MAVTSINVVDEQVGVSVPAAVDPVAVEVDAGGIAWQKVLIGLIPPHDYLSIDYPSATKEVWTYKQGGTYDGTTYTGGSTTGVIHTTYTDSTKQYVSHSGRVS